MSESNPPALTRSGGQTPALTALIAKWRESAAEALAAHEEIIDTERSYREQGKFLAYNMCADELETISRAGGQETPQWCTWTASDDMDCDYWESACGEMWTFTEGGPIENHCRFCHGCGKPVHVLPAPPAGGE